MTTVVNIATDQYDIYIGRGSEFGNPFVIGADGDRETVIRKYATNLRRRPDLLAKLESLRGKRLGCHCKPLACHGDIIVNLLEGDQPKVVHIETTGRCSARCVFCPHKQSSRRYTDMDDELFELIVRQLKDITTPFTVVPFKLGEPLLDRKLFPRLRYIEQELPLANLEIYSNLNYLPPNFISDLATLERVNEFVVSLNYCTSHEYEANMGLNFERTINNLNTLINSHLVTVRVNRVGSNNEVDTDDHVWIEWMRANFPGTEGTVTFNGNWCETVPNNLPTKKGGCQKLQELSICCDGIIAFCCMDGLCQYPIGDVKKDHLLKIYNKPELVALRQRQTLDDVVPCKTCTFGA